MIRSECVDWDCRENLALWCWRGVAWVWFGWALVFAFKFLEGQGGIYTAHMFGSPKGHSGKGAVDALL